MQNRPILVIDDDPRLCELATSILRQEHFEVLSAHDGPSGIELARTAQPSVILLDMMMPGIDGIGTCQRLKQDAVLRDIPVVGITGSDDPKLTEKVFRAGAGFFLSKPFQPSALVHVVKLALGSVQHVNRTQHRHHQPRLPAEVPVRCLHGGEDEKPREMMAHTGNVSLGGLLLFVPEKLGRGTAVRLVLELPEGPITAKATVMWQDSQPRAEQGFRHGIRFLGFVEDSGLIRYRRFLSQVAAAQVPGAKQRTETAPLRP